MFTRLKCALVVVALLCQPRVWADDWLQVSQDAVYRYYLDLNNLTQVGLGQQFSARFLIVSGVSGGQPAALQAGPGALGQPYTATTQIWNTDCAQSAPNFYPVQAGTGVFWPAWPNYPAMARAYQAVCYLGALKRDKLYGPFQLREAFEGR